MFTGVGLTSTSTGPATSVMLAGCATLRSSASTRDRREHRHARLADGHDVRARSEHLQELDDVVDDLVQPERAVLEADVAGVVPVGDVDVVVGQQRADGVGEQGREVPGQRGDEQHARLRRRAVGQVLGEAQQRAERGPATTSSCTATARTPSGVSTPTLSIPKGSRSWVIALSTKTWCAARSRRTGSRSAIGGGSRSSVSNAARDAARAPSSVTRCASYAAYSMRTPRTGRGPPSSGPRRRRRSHDNPPPPASARQEQFAQGIALGDGCLMHGSDRVALAAGRRTGVP